MHIKLWIYRRLCIKCWRIIHNNDKVLSYWSIQKHRCSRCGERGIVKEIHLYKKLSRRERKRCQTQ